MSEQVKNPHNKKNRRKLISNIIFLILLTILVVTMILSFGEISKISAQFQQIATGDNYKYLIIAIGLILLHFILWPASQCIYGKALKIEATVGESYLIGCSEHFYNGITPFAAGGQPFQIYSYTKRNVTTAKATGVILASFVTFLIVTNAFSLASLNIFNTFGNAIITSIDNIAITANNSTNVKPFLFFILSPNIILSQIKETLKSLIAFLLLLLK